VSEPTGLTDAERTAVELWRGQRAPVGLERYFAAAETLIQLAERAEPWLLLAAICERLEASGAEWWTVSLDCASGRYEVEYERTAGDGEQYGATAKARAETLADALAALAARLAAEGAGTPL
jgi:hypothetical protein